MTDTEIETIYQTISTYHQRYLLAYDIRLPSLRTNNGNYTKNALVLVYLSKNYPNTNIVTKDELTRFIKRYYPDTNDVQQARHLARQNGWYIISGRRGDISQIQIPDNCYKLISLEQTYPGFNTHRVTNINGDFWTNLKRQYNNRCASCGSPEGESNYVNPSAITQLQKGHKNPTLPLVENNIIPQCQECNRGDRNRWIYDDRGRVIGLTDEALLNRIKRIDRNLSITIINYLRDKYNI